ncbi:MAG: cyclomaltodextrinase N-terminal domain-containing protein, partial [Flavisolibacter sp.]|nr:cyclomaltodextrinase N-terminal domain-containing protein [Flavisolibacter sp.]
MRKFIVFSLIFLPTVFLFAQNKIDTYPTHWWTGMKTTKLQLMVHAPNVAENNFSLSYPGVRLLKTNKVENKNYVFLDLDVAASAKPGIIKINASNPSEKSELPFELKQRRRGNGSQYAQGVTAKDFIYLLMPDRFANGDPSNDAFPDMLDTKSDRNDPFLRHGGDIQGIINHLDYLKSLGVTALWLTPVVENDTRQTKEGNTMRSSYHGYHFTDQYKIDRRFGGNEEYKRLSDELHQRGMKLIQDAVYNHISQDHFTYTDMPMKDWVNQWPTYQVTSYKDQPLVDPYASQSDKKITINGWFTEFLPDLNQRNPYVSNYLTQYAIWATEEFGLDGWRVDTYFYSDSVFLNRVNAELYREFPSLTVFGETTVNSVTNGAFFSQNNFINIPFKHNTQGITDFPLFNAMQDGLNQNFGWTEGVSRVYNTLAQDIAYKEPTRNCIFLDNHDQDRIYSVIKEDFDKFKMGINWLLTLRGIPQLYYGTEILMKNFKDPTDAEVRRDFPGGWKEDAVNRFTQAGRTQQEQQAWQYISKLANFRKASPAITNGRLMQYLPENGLYTYFRYHPSQTVMVISHTGKDNI